MKPHFPTIRMRPGLLIKTLWKIAADTIQPFYACVLLVRNENEETFHQIFFDVLHKNSYPRHQTSHDEHIFVIQNSGRSVFLSLVDNTKADDIILQISPAWEFKISKERKCPPPLKSKPLKKDKSSFHFSKFSHSRSTSAIRIGIILAVILVSNSSSHQITTTIRYVT
jgi:hypothetical protein